MCGSCHVGTITSAGRISWCSGAGDYHRALRHRVIYCDLHAFEPDHSVALHPLSTFHVALPHLRPCSSCALIMASACVQVYELIQGALVRWTELTSAARPPPTAVLIHGILGSRKNMQSFARRITQVSDTSSTAF